jgi:DNA polymerase-1
LRWDVRRFARAVYGETRTLDVFSWVVRSTTEFLGLIEGLCRRDFVTICIDLETVGLHWWEDKVLSVGIGVPGGRHQGWIIPEELVYTQSVLAGLVALFEADNVTVVGHNVTFDIKFLQQLGVYNARFDHDTMLAHYVLDENTPRDLKTLSTAYLDAPDYEGEMIDANKRKKDGYDVIPRDILYKYNAYDVAYNLELWHLLRETLRDEGLYDRPYMYPIMAAVPHLAELERHGMPVDETKVHDVGVRLEQASDQLLATLIEGAGHEFNPRSWMQVQVIMYDEFGLPKRKGRGFKRGSTNKYARAEARKHLKPTDPRYQWLKTLDDYKSLQKMLSSYVRNLDIADGHVYPYYRLDGAESGRMSARDPAIQTIPRASTGEVGGVVWGQYIRGMFTAPQGYSFVGVDYSQAELRTAAYLSNDPSLMEAYKAGRDIHDETAAFLFGDDWTKEDRQIAKNFNFASIYSFSTSAFQVEEGFSVAKGRRLAQQFQVLRKGLIEWQKEQVKLIHRRGHVETLTGRRRRFPLIVSANSDEAAKAALNMPVQGTASDLTLMSFIAVCGVLKAAGIQPEDARVAALIHDELLLLVRNDLIEDVGNKVKEIMLKIAEQWMPTLPWKVDIEVGPDWGHMKEIQ